jgi:hypothetical protein
MFYKFNDPNTKATFQINRELVAYIRSAPATSPGKATVEILFSGGARLDFVLDNATADNLTQALTTVS